MIAPKWWWDKHSLLVIRAIVPFYCQSQLGISLTLTELSLPLPLTSEPMLTASGRIDDVGWPDRWTFVTADGSLSAQFEHTLLITKSGVEILTP